MSRTSLTSCPRCTHLCVGPSILPCSHLLCRKCLLFLLDTEPDTDVDCPTCHYTVLPAHTPGPRQVKQFPIDVVMERLVMKKLAEQAAGRCSVPHLFHSRPPSHVCLECGDVLCNACTRAHRKVSASRCHALKPLPPPLTQRASPSRRAEEDTHVNLLQHANTGVQDDLYRQVMSTCDRLLVDLRNQRTQREEDRHVLEAYKKHTLTDGVSLRRYYQVRQEVMSVAEKDMEDLEQVTSRRTQEKKLIDRTFPKAVTSRRTQEKKLIDRTFPKAVTSRRIPGGEVNRQDVPQSSIFRQKTYMPAKKQMSVVTSRRIPGGEVNRQDVPQSRGTWRQKLFLELTWTSDNMTVWVALSVLVTLLLGLLMVSLCPSPVVPYTADRVALQPLKAPASSLTGAPCGDHGCSSHYDDGVTDVLVTADRRVVLALFEKQSIVVQSSSGEETVTLGCEPRGLTQLPSGLLVVTCPSVSAVLLVRLASGDHQIQRIQTGKKYCCITAHPMDDALIVGTWPEPGVDIITLQSDVIRTIVDSSHMSLEKVTSLTVANDDLLLTDLKTKQVHRIHLQDSSPPPLESVAKTLASPPMDTAVDVAGNVFVVLRNGGVVMTSPEGHYRPLLTGWDDGKIQGCRVELHDDRLLVVTVTTDAGKSHVTEYQLVN